MLTGPPLNPGADHVAAVIPGHPRRAHVAGPPGASPARGQAAGVVIPVLMRRSRRRATRLPQPVMFLTPAGAPLRRSARNVRAAAEG
jgi:hypothetical protein